MAVMTVVERLNAAAEKAAAQALVIMAQNDRLEKQSKQLQKQSEQLKEQSDVIKELKAQVKELRTGPPAPAPLPLQTPGARPPAPAPAPGPVFMRENQLLLSVPESELAELVPKLRRTADLQRNGFGFDAVIRRPPRAQPGLPHVGRGPAQQGGPTRLVDLHFYSPAGRKAFASLGWLLQQSGIKVMDALTKAGVEMRNKRGPEYGQLKASGMQPRWGENGVDVTVWKNGRRVPHIFAPCVATT